MRWTRKTIVALAVSGALVSAGAVVATAAVFELPVFGLGADTSPAAAPIVVHRTIYHDHMVPKVTTHAAAGSHTASSGTSGAPRSEPTTSSVPVFAASTAAPAPSAPASPTTTAPETPATTQPAGTIPPPPAGCREPEWDPEHRVWQCAGAETGD